jgi:hypothetical protein
MNLSSFYGPRHLSLSFIQKGEIGALKKSNKLILISLEEEKCLKTEVIGN